MYWFGLNDDHDWQEITFVNPSHARQKEELLCRGRKQMLGLAALTIKGVEFMFLCTNWGEFIDACSYLDSMTLSYSTQHSMRQDFGSI